MDTFRPSLSAVATPDNLAEFTRWAETYPYCAALRLAHLRALRLASDEPVEESDLFYRVALYAPSGAWLHDYLHAPQSAPATVSATTPADISTTSPTHDTSEPSTDTPTTTPTTAAGTDPTTAAIDAFLSRSAHAATGRPTLPDPPATTSAPPVTATQPEPEIFSETLAKIYIRQGKFERAKNIFERLSLQYPNKSAYFADQIRYLQIIIDNKR